MSTTSSFSQRCREIFGNDQLYIHLQDTGITDYAQLIGSFAHVVSSQDFDDATCDVFLTATFGLGVVGPGITPASSMGSSTTFVCQTVTLDATVRVSVPGSSSSCSAPPAVPPVVAHVLAGASEPKNTVEVMLVDLARWRLASVSMESLRGYVQAAAWFPSMVRMLHESVVLVNGAPNSGKSTLCSAIASVLGLTRHRATSKLLWFYTRDDPPFINAHHWSNDSFYLRDTETFDWGKLIQSYSSVSSKGELQRSVFLLEGRRILHCADILDDVTTTIFLVSDQHVLEQRGSSPASMDHRRAFIIAELGNSVSLIHAPRAATLHASSPLPVLVNLALEKMIGDCNSLPVDHLQFVKPNGVALF